MDETNGVKIFQWISQISLFVPQGHESSLGHTLVNKTHETLWDLLHIDHLIPFTYSDLNQNSRHVFLGNGTQIIGSVSLHKFSFVTHRYRNAFLRQDLVTLFRQSQLLPVLMLKYLWFLHIFVVLFAQFVTVLAHQTAPTVRCYLPLQHLVF